MQLACSNMLGCTRSPPQTPPSGGEPMTDKELQWQAAAQLLAEHYVRNLNQKNSQKETPAEIATQVTAQVNALWDEMFPSP